VIISLIVAMDEHRGIGKDDRLPWHLSADLRRFKAITLGHHLIMGRKTYESIGRPLPGRTSIVITRNPNFLAEGCIKAHSFQEAVRIAQDHGETEVFIIGGGQIFAQALPFAQRIYLTLVHTLVEANVFFPEFDQTAWKLSESAVIPADQNNDYPSTYMKLEKIETEAE
jgi:dihydrofolate reductase